MPWKPALGGPTKAPLWKRVEASVRAAIERGDLRPGDRLPSAAAAAKALRVGKLTVVKAFRGLEAEGLLAGHVGKGTFVRDGKPAEDDGPRRGAAPADEAAAKALRRVREGYAARLRDLLRLERKPGTIDLAGGVPSPDSVPEDLLGRLAKQVLASDPRRLYGYGGEAGLPELRKAIAEGLRRSGVRVDPDQVLVTNGSQQAAALVAAWARDEERAFVGETPTFIGIPQAFLLFGHGVATVEWDDEGIDLDAVRAAAGTSRVLLHTCPDFQNPTGRTATLESRRAVAAWAAESDGVVMEDAIARELRFEGEPLPSLFSLLPPGRRILVGSVSKTFMTGLRVGYLVADPPLVDALRPFKRAMDLGSPSLVQAVAAAFLEDGYAEHLEAVRARYRAGRDALVEAIEAEMPAGTAFTRPSGGFQLWVTPPAGVSSVDLYLRGLAHGVAIGPGPVHDVDGRFPESFRLGYGRATPHDIREGVKRLARAHSDLRSRTTPPGVAV
jgi:2-aminoadipate transaminase